MQTQFVGNRLRNSSSPLVRGDAAGAVTPAGAVIDEGWTPATRMAWRSWLDVQIADARKAKAVGSLVAKTPKLDARVLAALARRDLVPQVHVPTFLDREFKERLGRRMHMVWLRAMNRLAIFVAVRHRRDRRFG